MDIKFDETLNEPIVDPSEVTLNGYKLDQVQQIFGNNTRYVTARRRLFNDSVEKEPKSSGSQLSQTQPVPDCGLHFSPNSGQIFLANIHQSITDSDLKTIFSTFGQLDRCAVNYQRSGRSYCTALIVFKNKRDAVTAYNILNGESLKGQKMILELIGSQNPKRVIKFIETKPLAQNNNIVNKTDALKRRRHFWSDRDNTDDKENEDEEEDSFDCKRLRH